MGKYITASEAARRIGITDKTVRTWIMQDKLKAHHVTPTQLAILETDVEKIIHERKPYRNLPDTSVPSAQIIELEARITELESLVVGQQEQIIDAACRISELELRNFLYSPLEQASRPSVQSKPTNEISPVEEPQNRDTELLGGTLTASNFAAQLGISYEQLKNYMRRGVNSEHLEITEIKHPTRAGYMQKYFTYEQQQKALAILKRHGKLPDI